jgi:hypothetical protein
VVAELLLDEFRQVEAGGELVAGIVTRNDGVSLRLDEVKGVNP